MYKIYYNTHWFDHMKRTNENCLTKKVMDAWVDGRDLDLNGWITGVKSTLSERGVSVESLFCVLCARSRNE